MKKKIDEILEKKYDAMWDLHNQNEKERHIIAGAMTVLEDLFRELYGK